jgi:hypothetical protein
MERCGEMLIINLGVSNHHLADFTVGLKSDFLCSRYFIQ